MLKNITHGIWAHARTKGGKMLKGFQIFPIKYSKNIGKIPHMLTQLNFVLLKVERVTIALSCARKLPNFNHCIV